jgi:DNA-binding NtrC family response regulator
MRHGIVCVDDEALLVACMKQDLLSFYGGRFVCETAKSAEEALDVIDELIREEVEIDLVISDWLMPGLKGDVLLSRVRERCPEARLMLVSGQVDDEAIERMRASLAGFSYIEKPWRAQRLVSEIDRLLEAPTAAGKRA